MSRKESFSRLQKELVAKRDALRKQVLTDLAVVPSGGTGSDLVDAAATGSQTELNSHLAAIESRDLHQIERAITRIREGRYGLCEACDTRIPMERLKALPYTNLCIHCQQKLERSGKYNVEETDWEGAFEYEGAHSTREMTIRDIDIDLN